MSGHEAGVWHRKVIPASTESALNILRDADILDDFYLAGGTGLALQFGHRLSLDLDFFSAKRFNEESLLQSVQALGEFALVAKAPFTLHATLGTTKISFLGYLYPVLFPYGRFADIAIADPRDIACMKISAVAGRGTKRDFVDLFVCARRYGLTELLQLFAKKYAQVRYSKPHILKSLTFFGDAEKDPMPKMLTPIKWEEVKHYFLHQAPRAL